MEYQLDKLPGQLPETPNHWRKKLQMHLNYGTEGGSASYAVFTPEDLETPIEWQYDTRSEGLTGFSLGDLPDVMTWPELVAAWPGWLASERAKGKKSQVQLIGEDTEND